MENVDKTQEERDPVSAAESFSREKPAAPAADAAAAPSLKVEAGDGKTAPSIHLEEDASDALKTEAGGGNGLPPGGTAGSLTAVPEPEPKPERSNLPAELPKSSQQTPHPKGTLAQLWDLFWDTFQNRYWKFSGRANRTEFWTFFLGGLFVSSILNVLASQPFIGFFAALASAAWWIVTLVPTWTVAFRRLHDAGRSGWWITAPLIVMCALFILFPLSLFFSFFTFVALGPVCFITGVLFVIVLIFCALPGERKANRWGEPPEDLRIF